MVLTRNVFFCVSSRIKRLWACPSQRDPSLQEKLVCSTTFPLAGCLELLERILRRFSNYAYDL
eukprot:40199-Prymnesium_polylepis.1